MLLASFICFMCFVVVYFAVTGVLLFWLLWFVLLSLLVCDLLVCCLVHVSCLFAGWLDLL